jgi:tetratricopeptide (TPR) repeat protein
MARRLLRSGASEEAARLLTQLLRENPSDTRAWDYLAAAYYDMGAWEESLDALRRVIKQWPHKARCWRNYAMVLRKLGHIEEAMRAAQQAMRLDPHYRKAHVEMRKVRRLLRLPVCEICGMPIELAEGRPCRGCGWQYHKECWEEQRGCANPACSGDELTITVSDHRRTPRVPTPPPRSGCLPWASFVVVSILSLLAALLAR